MHVLDFGFDSLLFLSDDVLSLEGGAAPFGFEVLSPFEGFLDSLSEEVPSTFSANSELLSLDSSFPLDSSEFSLSNVSIFLSVMI